jgi:hypothetical protein
MTQRHRRRTLALVLLVPVVTVVGALLGFMAAAHLG